MQLQRKAKHKRSGEQYNGANYPPTDPLTLSSLLPDSVLSPGVNEMNSTQSSSSQRSFWGSSSAEKSKNCNEDNDRSNQRHVSPQTPSMFFYQPQFHFIARDREEFMLYTITEEATEYENTEDNRSVLTELSPDHTRALSSNSRLHIDDETSEGTEETLRTTNCRPRGYPHSPLPSTSEADSCTDSSTEYESRSQTRSVVQETRSALRGGKDVKHGTSGDRSWMNSWIESWNECISNGLPMCASSNSPVNSRDPSGKAAPSPTHHEKEGGNENETSQGDQQEDDLLADDAVSLAEEGIELDYSNLPALVNDERDDFDSSPPEKRKGANDRNVQWLVKGPLRAKDRSPRTKISTSPKGSPRSSKLIDSNLPNPDTAQQKERKKLDGFGDEQIFVLSAAPQVVASREKTRKIGSKKTQRRFLGMKARKLSKTMASI